MAAVHGPNSRLGKRPSFSTTVLPSKMIKTQNKQRKLNTARLEFNVHTPREGAHHRADEGTKETVLESIKSTL